MTSGVSSPVAVLASAKDVARALDSAVSSASTFAVSAALAAGATCFQVSLPFSFSNATVCPPRAISTRVVLNDARVEQILHAEIVGRLLQLVDSADSTVKTIGRERSFA